LADDNGNDDNDELIRAIIVQSLYNILQRLDTEARIQIHVTEY